MKTTLSKFIKLLMLDTATALLGGVVGVSLGGWIGGRQGIMPVIFGKEILCLNFERIDQKDWNR